MLGVPKLKGSDMPQTNPAALDFLLNRRSRPAKTLDAPGPDRAAFEPILQAALRSPDHKKLEPWRLIVLGEAALRDLVAPTEARGAELGISEAEITKQADSFRTCPTAVAVVVSPVAHDKVPEMEQHYSAGAVCLQLLNAALASGWGANWLTGWATHDAQWREQTLGLAPHERLAGIIHIGTERNAPPERPRPDPETKIDWRL